MDPTGYAPIGPLFDFTRRMTAAVSADRSHSSPTVVVATVVAGIGPAAISIIVIIIGPPITAICIQTAVAKASTKVTASKTAVAEAAMNAMEHGNHYQPEVPIDVEVLASDSHVVVRISDEGGASEIPQPETPDLAAKLAGEQSPRGWGLYLIQNLVDEMKISLDGQHHTIELIVKRQEATNASQYL